MLAWLVAAASIALPTPAHAAIQQEPPASDEPPPEEPDCDPDDPDDPDCEPPAIRIIGAGGGGGSGSGVTFDWNGPGRLDYGIYDHGCKNIPDELGRLIRANQPLIASVMPQALQWDGALAAVRARIAAEPAMRAAYEAARDLDPKADMPLDLAATDVSLAQLFASVEKSPDNPMRLFNLAGALSREGMANEALAITARIRALGKLPDMPLDINDAAALDYQEGYAEMLRGNLAAAKSRFGSVIGQEPFLNSAAHSLALIQSHEGAGTAARATYQAGMWRFKPKYLVACGGSVDDVRPPVDDMFDTSMGVEPRLVEFWHPDKATDLEPFYKQMGALAQSRMAIVEPLRQRMIAMGDNARFAGGTGDPYDDWAEKLTQLISGLDEDEPYVLQAQDALESARRVAGRIAGENQVFVLERVVQLAMQPGNHCPTYRSLISNGIQGVLPHAERLEAAFREYARVWYKMATGLTSNIGDPEWFEYNDVALRAELESMNLGMLVEIMGLYGFPADLVKECPEEFVDMFAAQVPPAEPADPCTELFGNMTLKHTIAMPKGAPGPKFDVEVGCKEIKVDGEFNMVNVSHGPLGLQMGARTSASFKRGQGFDMFLGVGADAKAFGRSGSAQAGAFVSGDANGLTDLGGRTKLNRVDGTKESMDFGLMAKPTAAPRGPPIRNFRPGP